MPNNLYHVVDQQTVGNNSSSPKAAGTWNKLDLNTELTTEIAGASLAAGVITLPAGTYRVRGHVPFGQNGSSTSAILQIRLRDTTNSATLISQNGRISNQCVVVMPFEAEFTLAGSTNIELQGYNSATSGNLFWGYRANYGTEIYSSLEIREL